MVDGRYSLTSVQTAERVQSTYRPLLGRTVPNSPSQWTVEHSLIAIALGPITVVATRLSIGSVGRDSVMLILGIIWVTIFFLSFSLFTETSSRRNEHQYVRLLFGVALIIRVVAVILVYAAFQSAGGSPFEPHAADSLHYHAFGMALADRIRQGALELLPGTNPSDLGYVAFTGVFYSIFGVTVLGLRLAQALLGAWSSVLVYRFTKLAVGDDSARTVGTLFALSPYYVYYTGLHLKETLLVFLIVNCFYLTAKISQSEGSAIRSGVSLLLTLAALFFFRTFVAVLLICSVCLHLLVQRRARAGVLRRLAIAVGIVGGLTILVFNFQPGLNVEILRTWKTGTGQWEREFQDKESKLGGEISRSLVTQPSFVALAAVGPLPSVVGLEGQENSLIQFGFSWVRYVMLFFALIGLYVAAKEGRRSLAVMLVFLSGYVLILGISGLATSHRFQLPTLAGWMVLTGIGLHAPLKREKMFMGWMASLLIIVVAVVVWNYLKVAVRTS